jgi:hypothetical protein
LDQLDPLVKQAFRASLVILALQDQSAPQEPLVPKVSKAVQVRQVPQVYLETLAPLVQQVQLDQLDSQDPKVPKDKQASKELLDCLEEQDLLALQVCVYNHIYLLSRGTIPFAS